MAPRLEARKQTSDRPEFAAAALVASHAQEDVVDEIGEIGLAFNKPSR